MWRHLHPDLRHYTYFSYRFDCRSKGIGWRLDTCEFDFHQQVLADTEEIPVVVLSERIVDKVKMCEIRSEIYGASDHCPIVMEVEGEL
jgi:AP endonuclease 1